MTMNASPTAIAEERTICPICSNPETRRVGSKRGTIQPIDFLLRRCDACGFSYVANPWTDYAAIYTRDYYEGTGVDPRTDYYFELEHPEATVHRYEWRGLEKVVGSLIDLKKDSNWIDYGCGNGALVRHLRGRGYVNCEGFDEGHIVDDARKLGIPILRREELSARYGTCDVVTSIEVLEHVIEPLEALREMRKLLKPGGLLFLTTGNAEPFRNKIETWDYVTPEIHVSFFEPATVARALELTGFRPAFPGRLPGLKEIIQFKVLKNLDSLRDRWWHHLLPWPLLTYPMDKLRKVSAHPIGWAV